MKKTLFLVAMATMLTACESTLPRKALNLSLKANDKPINTFIVIYQDELNVIVPMRKMSVLSLPLGGIVGAVGSSVATASINNSNAIYAEEKLARIRNGLLDFKFDRDIGVKAYNTFSKIEDVDLLPFRMVRHDGLVASKVAPGDTYFYVSFNYELTADYRAPTITARAKMVLRGESAKTDVVLYANDFHYTGNVLKLSREKYEKRKKHPVWITEAYAYSWATSHNKQLTVELEAGVEELFSLILKDMQDTESTKFHHKRAGTAIKYGFDGIDRYSPVMESESRVVIRSGNKETSGALCSFTAGIKKSEEQYCIF